MAIFSRLSPLVAACAIGLMLLSLFMYREGQNATERAYARGYEAATTEQALVAERAVREAEARSADLRRAFAEQIARDDAARMADQAAFNAELERVRNAPTNFSRCLGLPVPDGLRRKTGPSDGDHGNRAPAS